MYLQLSVNALYMKILLFTFLVAILFITFWAVRIGTNLSMMKEMRLQTVASVDTDGVYRISESDWKLPLASTTIPQGTAGTSIPLTAASRSFPNGNIMIKYEGGYVYAVKVSGVVR